METPPMTVAQRFSRTEIIRRLRSEVDAGRPIIGAGCSSGLIARAAVAGGADLVIVYNTGRSRLAGLPTSATGNHANPTTMAMYREIANVVPDVPIVGGAEAADPTYLYDVPRLVDDYVRTGFDGVINFPTTGARNTHNPERDAVGLGVHRDYELVAAARAADTFTICYAYTEEQARGVTEAGADAIVPHVGWTTGGFVGAGASALELDAACERVQSFLEVARAVNPDVFVLSHGGPLEGADSTRYLYENTDAQGFLGASSVERLPVEAGIVETIHGFRQHRPRASRTTGTATNGEYA
ncbi:phosphoenolpyruvate hydrolase family protein [Microbacterium esteraromaticum]|uniref:Phosphoenolpyruvate hydrolase family protein n=2 Tax=Microbacterium esteraromaticum TaxID=57043 RepID=A0A7D8AFS7_9MICO|nr:phosphoenolpyruvate hydrolase family protein [Microbacterium esteraromaticum]